MENIPLIRILMSLFLSYGFVFLSADPSRATPDKNIESEIEIYSKEINSRKTKKHYRALAYRSRGRLYLEIKEYNKAIHDFSQYIIFEPNGESAYRERSDAYFAKGDFDLALKDMELYAKSNPHDRDRPNRAALIRIMLEAQMAARNAPAAPASSAPPLNSVAAGANAAQSGDADFARCREGNVFAAVIAACSRILSERQLSEKDSAQIHSRRGNAYHATSDRDRAIADYSEAIRLDPKLISVYFDRGQAHREKGEKDRAIADFSEVIRLEPRATGAYTSRGAVYRDKGDRDRAIADYSEAIRLDPKQAPAYFNRGLIHSDGGEFSRALADMESFVKLEPRDDSGLAQVQHLRAALAARKSPTASIAVVPPLQTTSSLTPPAFAVAGRRVALVVGNDGYRQIDRLLKARGDADAIAATLKTMGFETTLAHDLDNLGFGQVLDRFVASLQPTDTALFFFAGQGVEVDGTNYLLPTDMPNIDPGQTQFQRSAYKVREIVDRIRQRSVRVAIAVIDACRDNPLRAAGQRGSGTRGLGRMEAEEGEFLLFSAGPKQAALDRLSDSDASPTSVFTRIFVKHLPTPGASLVEIAKKTQTEVRALARTAQRSHAQFPDYADRIDGNFSLVPQLQPAAAATTPVAPPPSAAQAEFELARAIGTAAAWDAFLARNPTGFLADTARRERQGLPR